MEKIKEAVQQHGSRRVAITLIGNRVSELWNVSLTELPYMVDFAPIIDKLDNVLSGEFTKEQISDVLNKIDMDFIESLVYH